MREGRLWREASFDLGAKVWQVNWLYVVLLCALAGVGCHLMAMWMERSTLTVSSCSSCTSSLGWFTRPQLMSVMCSRPSTPPMSTNAP